MSRIANQPVQLPSGTEVNIGVSEIAVKGAKGQLTLSSNKLVKVEQHEGALTFSQLKDGKKAHSMSGTMRALLQNMVTGVTTGFEKKLNLVGVGYRAALQGKDLNLNLGFSHPVIYKAPEGITFEVNKQTEIVVQGIDKQRVGQVCAEIRSLRPPEPYKGKGVRYSDERVSLKEAKKK